MNKITNSRGIYSVKTVSVFPYGSSLDSSRDPYVMFRDALDIWDSEPIEHTFVWRSHAVGR